MGAIGKKRAVRRAPEARGSFPALAAACAARSSREPPEGAFAPKSLKRSSQKEEAA